MGRALVAVVAFVAGCGSSAAPPAIAPSTPAPAQPELDELGTVRPRSYAPQKVEHLDARAAELVANGDHLGCGDHYVGRHDARPDAPDADQLLFNAATCYAEARAIGVAQRLRAKLVSAHPHSRYVPDTLIAIGHAWAQLAAFREAATGYETYASRFSDRSDAPEALLLAVRYRLGLGDGDGALADAQQFARTYGSSLPEQAAEVDLLVTAVYARRADNAGLIAHIDRFERRYATGARLGQRIAAMVTRGRARWQQACPVAAIERGVCAHLDPAPPDPGCGPKSRKLLWRIAAREPKLAARALDDFRQAVALWEATPAAQRRLEASYWAAAAQFHLGEEHLERYLRLTLDLGGSQEDMQRRFAHFLGEFRTLHGQTQTAYRKVLGYDDGALYWGVAAEARMAQSQLRFIDLLLSSQLPDSIRDSEYGEEVQDAYCDQIMEVSQPILERAIDTLEACTRLASAAGWYDVWTRWCQDELALQRPAVMPPLREWFTGADLIGSATAEGAGRAALEAHLAADPSAVGPSLALAELELRQLPLQAAPAGRAAEAAMIQRRLRAVLAVDPDNTAASVLLAMVLLAADSEADASRQLARLVVDDARKRSPDSAEVINAQGVVAARGGQLGLAYSLFREAQLVASDFLPSHLNAGSAALQLRKLDQAVTHFEDAVALAPAAHDAHLGLGVALRARGDLPGAERAYRSALVLEPARPEAAFDLGILFRDFHAQLPGELPATLGAVENAEVWFRQAIAAPALSAEQREIVQRELETTERLLVQLRNFVRATGP